MSSIREQGLYILLLEIRFDQIRAGSHCTQSLIAIGLGGSSGGYSSHEYTSHASLRAYGAQLRGDRLFSKVYLFEDPPQHF